MQLGGADCISQCLFLVLHTTLFGFFLCSCCESWWEGLPFGGKWTDWFHKQNWMWAELSSCSEPYRPLSPQEYSGWRELLGFIAVTDMGSWLRDTRSGCVKAGAHLNMLVLNCVCGLTGRKKENFLLSWFLDSSNVDSIILEVLKLDIAQPLDVHPIFEITVVSSSMQFWSRFSNSAFALDVGSLVCFSAPHHLRTSWTSSKKDSCCSPSSRHCVCPRTITVLSWRHSLFGKNSQRSDLPKGAEVFGEAEWEQTVALLLLEPKAPLLASFLPASSGSLSLTEHLWCWCHCDFYLQPGNGQVCCSFSSILASAVENG